MGVKKRSVRGIAGMGTCSCLETPASENRRDRSTAADSYEPGASRPVLDWLVSSRRSEVLAIRMDAQQVDCCTIVECFVVPRQRKPSENG